MSYFRVRFALAFAALAFAAVPAAHGQSVTPWQVPAAASQRAASTPAASAAPAGAAAQAKPTPATQPVKYRGSVRSAVWVKAAYAKYGKSMFVWKDQVCDVGRLQMERDACIQAGGTWHPLFEVQPTQVGKMQLGTGKVIHVLNTDEVLATADGPLKKIPKPTPTGVGRITNSAEYDNNLMAAALSHEGDVPEPTPTEVTIHIRGLKGASSLVDGTTLPVEIYVYLGPYHDLNGTTVPSYGICRQATMEEFAEALSQGLVLFEYKAVLVTPDYKKPNATDGLIGKEGNKWFKIVETKVP